MLEATWRCGMQLAGAVFLDTGAQLEASRTKFKGNKASVGLPLLPLLQLIVLHMFDGANVLVRGCC